jgi:hypothetical protein
VGVPCVVPLTLFDAVAPELVDALGGGFVDAVVLELVGVPDGTFGPELVDALGRGLGRGLVDALAPELVGVVVPELVGVVVPELVDALTPELVGVVGPELVDALAPELVGVADPEGGALVDVTGGVVAGCVGVPADCVGFATVDCVGFAADVAAGVEHLGFGVAESRAGDGIAEPLRLDAASIKAWETVLAVVAVGPLPNIADAPLAAVGEHRAPCAAPGDT